MSWIEGGGGWLPPRPDIAPRPDVEREPSPWWVTRQQAPSGPRRRRGRALLAGVLAVLVLTGSGIAIGWSLGSGSGAGPNAALSPQGPLTTTPPAPGSSPFTVRGVAAKVSPAVVDIDTVIGSFPGRRALGRAAGTGMILTANGEVLTNNHVITGATSIRVTVQHRGEFRATVIGADPVDDVALLQLSNASHLPTVSLGDPSAVSVGDPIVAVGNALGRGGTPAVSQGTVQGTGRSVDVQDEHGGFEHLHDLIQMSAGISPGDSGGALVDMRAHVIGMITAARTAPNRPVSHLGFAIPVSNALRIVNEIRAGHRSSTIIVGEPGFLGVEVEDFTQTKADQAGLDVNQGAYVAGIIPGAPAARAGMRAPAVITSIDGRAITTTDDLGPRIYTHRPGDRISVTWVDRTGSHTATVALIAGPAV